MQQKISLSLFPLCLGETTCTALTIIAIRFNCNRLEFVIAVAPVRLWISVALLTKIVVGTGIAMVSLSTQNLAIACHALLHEFRCITIVEVPKYHHRCMLRTTKLVKLVMVSSTKVQKCLTVVQEFTVKIFSIVINDFNGAAVFIKRCILFAFFTVGISLCARLQCDLLVWIFFTVLGDCLWYFHVFFLGTFPIQECNDETLLHRLDRFAELHHHLIPIKFIEILDTIHHTTCNQSFFVYTCRSGSASIL
mmetsp:Transcript_65053/g.187179  ORF Transcript_65053/g.187179 Transcript_65053/m.187179 type:complete len:250 (+) Transcript_65053:319-1068(+)